MNHPLLTSHVLDANVFIQAQQRYYATDICPGFWECLASHAGTRRLVSIDRVRSELVGRPDEVAAWAKAQPSSFFASTREPTVITEYSTLVQWVQNNAQFSAAAKAGFAAGADGWLIAYAKAHTLTVVTQEVLAPNTKRRVPIPNICEQFAVPYVGTFELLRTLNAQFTWIP